MSSPAQQHVCKHKKFSKADDDISYNVAYDAGDISYNVAYVMGNVPLHLGFCRNPFLSRSCVRGGHATCIESCATKARESLWKNKKHIYKHICITYTVHSCICL